MRATGMMSLKFLYPPPFGQTSLIRIANKVVQVTDLDSSSSLMLVISHRPVNCFALCTLLREESSCCLLVFLELYVAAKSRRSQCRLSEATAAQPSFEVAFPVSDFRFFVFRGCPVLAVASGGLARCYTVVVS